MSSRSYLALLRQSRDFRHYFAGQLVSYLGDWFSTVGMYSAVAELSSSGRAIALVLVAKTLPIFLVSPVAGPLVDRFDRRRVLLMTDFARCAGAIGLVMAHLAGNLVALYACAVFMAANIGLAMPAKNAALPMIVAGADIPRANALVGGTWSAMLALGAATGGIATALLGIDAAFLIDGGTFLLSAMFIARLPALPPPAREHGARTALGDGLRYLLRDRYVLALACLKPSMHLAGGVFALLPLYGTVVFDTGGPLLIGIFYAVRGVGSLAGSLGLRVVFGDRPQTMRRLLVLGYLALGGIYLGLGHAATPFWAGACYAASGLATGLIWVFSGTLLQTEADRRFHGRVFAFEFGTLTLVLAASSYVSGAAVDLGYTVREATLAFVPLTLVGAAVASTAVWLGGNRHPASVVSRGDERPRAG